jgi:phosphate transport system permease protein
MTLRPGGSPETSMRGLSRPALRGRAGGNLGDAVFSGLTAGLAGSVIALLAGIILLLVIYSWDSISRFGLGFIGGSVWDPIFERFGVLPFI